MCGKRCPEWEGQPRAFIALWRGNALDLAAAKAAGAVTIRYGVFINAVLDFLIVAVVIFFLIRAINKLVPKPKPAAAAPATKDCPFCLSAVPLKATRCPHCTSQLAG